MADPPRFVRFFNLWSPIFEAGTNWPEIKSSLIQRAMTWHHLSHLADLGDEQTAGTKLGSGSDGTKLKPTLTTHLPLQARHNLVPQ